MGDTGGRGGVSGAGLTKGLPPCFFFTTLSDTSLPPKSKHQPVGASKATKLKEFKTKCRIFPCISEPPGKKNQKPQGSWISPSSSPSKFLQTRFCILNTCHLHLPFAISSASIPVHIPWTRTLASEPVFSHPSHPHAPLLHLAVKDILETQISS